MKRLLIAALLCLPASLTAQIIYVPNPNSVNSLANSSGCRITSPVVVTGDTSAHQVLSCVIPAGSVGTNGIITLTLRADPCTATGAPYASCTAVNTGQTAFQAYLASTPTGTDQPIRSSAFGVTQAASGGTLQVMIQAENSLTSQVGTWSTMLDSNLANPRIIPIPTLAQNLVNTAYLNIFFTNANTTDRTFLSFVDVTVK